MSRLTFSLRRNAIIGLGVAAASVAAISAAQPAPALAAATLPAPATTQAQGPGLSPDCLAMLGSLTNNLGGAATDPGSMLGSVLGSSSSPGVAQVCSPLQ
jgi:hypothetical protein